MPEIREIRLEPDWKAHLQDEFTREYMICLREFLLERKQAGAVIYPPGPQIFNALDSKSSEFTNVLYSGSSPSFFATIRRKSSITIGAD